MRKLIVVSIVILGLLCVSDDSFAQPMVLTTSKTSPLSKKDQTGFYDQILIEAFQRVEQTIQIKHLPTERSITNAN